MTTCDGRRLRRLIGRVLSGSSLRPSLATRGLSLGVSELQTVLCPRSRLMACNTDVFLSFLCPGAITSIWQAVERDGGSWAHLSETLSAGGSVKIVKLKCGSGSKSNDF